MPVKNGQNASIIAMLKNWSSNRAGSQKPKQVKGDPGRKRTL